jgi:hypothetical protein
MDAMKILLLSFTIIFVLTSCTPAADSTEKALSYRLIKADEAPETVRQQLSTILHTGGSFSKEIENEIYVALALGERNTGGYQITITKAVKQNRQLNIFAKEVKPDPTELVTQAITYPTTIIVFPKEDIEKINIHFNQNDYSHFYNKEVKCILVSPLPKACPFYRAGFLCLQKKKPS